MSERAVGAAGNPENNAPPNLQLRDLLERAIFYLGVPAITLYPLGVLFYWIQIRSHYDISADASWQAVFTIPREFLIAKTAAMVVEGFAFATPDLLLTALIIYVPITIGWRRVWGTGWRTNHLRRILTLLALIFVILWTLFMIYLIVTGLQGGSVRRAAAVYQILTIAAALMAGYLIATDRKKNRTSPNLAMAPIFVRRWFLRGALVAYTAVIIGIFILGSALPIQLPTITFGEDSERESGLLLGDPGSVCGYWYYIDTQGRVVALPSEEATDVVVVEEPGA
jgi:hypothetical protein